MQPSYIVYDAKFIVINDRQTDGNFIDSKKSQLGLHVMCIRGMLHKTKTNHRQTLKMYIKCI